ncbi:MAG: hypothetical protein ACE5G9_09215 [Nitrospinales bacterium]
MTTEKQNLRAIQAFEYIRNSVNNLRSSNDEVIDTKTLKEFINSIYDQISSEERTTPNLTPEQQRDYYNAQNQFTLAQYNHQYRRDWMIASIKASVDLAGIAIKSALLINGGATVAILAFLGNFLSKDAQKTVVLNALASPLGYFSLGVVTAAIGSGLAYCSQRSYLEEWNKAGICFNLLAVIFIVATYGAFIFGACDTYSIFKNPMPIP